MMDYREKMQVGDPFVPGNQRYKLAAGSLVVGYNIRRAWICVPSAMSEM